MAGVAAHRSPTDFLVASGDAMGSELYSRRTSVRAPEPNPNFSFPRRLSESTSPAPAPAAAAATDMPAHPTRKRIRPTDLSLLPHHPSEQEQFSTSPSHHMMDPSSQNTSPSKARPMSSRGGHRRGGSEFIGGDATSTGPGLMSGSPTRAVTAAAAPAPPGPLGPAAPSLTASAGRRKGHAHRRSGAMSTTDFSAILNHSISNAPPLPGSAPASPSSNPPMIPPMLPFLERHNSHPGMTAQEKIDEANAAAHKEDQEMAASETAGEPRTRVVGFSDKVVIIPRPLSTISSGDTESTMSTVRPAHSLSGSINSMLDQRPPTPVSATLPPESSDDSRPATSDNAAQVEFFGPAEDLLDNHEQEREQQRPSSGSGNRLLMKRRRSPPPHLVGDEDMSPRTGVDPNFRWAAAASDGLSSPRMPSPVTEAKSEKRKSGLRSILSRKHRRESRESSSRGPATPTTPATPATPATPTLADANVPDGLMSLDDVNFDDDTTCVILSADYEEPKQAPVLHPSPSPMKEDFDRDDSAVLDLDATYNAVQIDDDSPGSLANFMGGAIPMRQHRRTESAPSLSPMQRLNFGPGKASPKMADVFEEDEEDEALQQRTQRPKARSFHQPKSRNLQGLGVQIVDADAGGAAAQPRRKSRSPSSKATTTHTPETASGASATETTITTAAATALAADTDNHRFSTLTKSSDDGTITPGPDGSPRLQPNPALDAPLLDPISTVPHPLDFALPPSVRPHAHNDSADYSLSSAAPSPNPTTVSFDAPRLNTAASSITDRTNWSSAPSQANNSSNALSCRPIDSTACEDVPSLTSSMSTAFSGQPPGSAVGSASPSPIVPRGPSASPFGQAYHAHTFSGMSRPRTMGFAGGEGSSIARPNSVAADRSFSIAGLGGLSPRASMPRPWASRPNTANTSKRSSLASLSKLMSKGDSERSKLSISWGAHDDRDSSSDAVVLGAKEGREKSGKRRLSKMFKFLKGKSKDRGDGGLASAEHTGETGSPSQD